MAQTAKPRKPRATKQAIRDLREMAGFAECEAMTISEHDHAEAIQRGVDWVREFCAAAEAHRKR